LKGARPVLRRGRASNRSFLFDRSIVSRPATMQTTAKEIIKGLTNFFWKLMFKPPKNRKDDVFLLVIG